MGHDCMKTCIPQVVNSNCFGAGGSYQMDIRNSMMILLSQNVHSTQITFQIDGNLGAVSCSCHFLVIHYLKSKCATSPVG
eukprot:SAG31_NODE_365_length_16833_cov_98.502032_3_plen_80_part_00